MIHHIFLGRLPIIIGVTLATISFAYLIAEDHPPHSIYYLARKGDLAAVKARVEQDPSVVEARKGRDTLLHYAAKGGHVEVIDYLIAQGAEIEARDANDRTPLHHAADHNRPEAVERLIALGADVNARDDFNSTPLHLAADTTWTVTGKEDPPEVVKRRLKTVKRLIALEAEIDARDNLGRTPLHHAAEDNQAAVVGYLISHGAAIDARDRSGETPLHLAAGSIFGSFEAVKTLVRLGADPNARMRRENPRLPLGQSVLARAATWGHLDIVKFLLEQGAPVRYGEDEDDTALHEALTGWQTAKDPEDSQTIADRIKAIDLLADRLGIADPEAGKLDRGFVMATALKSYSPEVVRYLLKHHAEEITSEDIDEALKHVTVSGDRISWGEQAKLRELLHKAKQAAMDVEKNRESKKPGSAE